MRFDGDEDGRATRQQPGHRDAAQRHGGLQHGVEAHRPPQAVRLAAQDPAAQRQAQEECADRAGNGADLHAHHQRQLLDPQHLEHQGRRSRQEQQRGRPDRRQDAPCRSRVFLGRACHHRVFRHRVFHITSMHRRPASPQAHRAAPSRCRAARQAPPGPAPAYAGAAYLPFCFSSSWKCASMDLCTRSWTWSTLKLAGRWLGGYLTKVSRNSEAFMVAMAVR
ncbi:hypothetical protein LMG26858_00841 [Achromobacter anxifer]|uniref:Uncharacterized protein n=1 Tax=Achromobacter anxifer TaxID=1287737 RepID=A0A6S7C5V0_9BURK|nr:hypothetical protein LMG26858_00841 [Achromobacter anxifer]